jgi:glycosyltransferase involved in cell wall biosynthesis
MRILVVSDEIYPDAVGGVGRSLMNECSAFAAHGHEVTVFVRSWRADLAQEDMINGVRVVRFQGPVRGTRFYYLYPLISIWKTAAWLRANAKHYDVLYVHNPFYLLAALFAGVQKTVPLTTTFYSSIGEEVRINARRGKYGVLRPIALLAAQIVEWIERWVYLRANVTLPRSHFTAEGLRRLWPQFKAQASYIPAGINTQRYQPQNKRAARQQLSLPEAQPIVITVRRLEGRMGLPNLVEAMDIVHRQHGNVLLLIGGKGYLHSQLEAQILSLQVQENVRLLGFVPEEQLPTYLAAADLFVLPTEYLEGFGVATIEALACGTPAIGTPVGATPEILASLDPALLTEDASAAAIAELICHWLGNMDALPKLSERSRAYALEHFDIDIVARQLEAVFAEAISRHSAR